MKHILIFSHALEIGGAERALLGLLAHYKEKAIERGRTFSTEATVRAVEEMLERL